MSNQLPWPSSSELQQPIVPLAEVSSLLARLHPTELPISYELMQLLSRKAREKPHKVVSYQTPDGLEGQAIFEPVQNGWRLQASTSSVDESGHTFLNASSSFSLRR